MGSVAGTEGAGPACWSPLLEQEARPLTLASWPPQVRVFLQPPLKGVVMETFGSGNGPTKPDLLQELRVAAERGLVIVNCTHCLQGAVTSDYGAGTVGRGHGGLGREGRGKSGCDPVPHRPPVPPFLQALAGAGTISGSDMTSEAALAKLSYVLGLPGLSLDGRKEVRAPPAGDPGPHWRAVGPSPGDVCLGLEGGRGRGAPPNGCHPQARALPVHTSRSPRSGLGSGSPNCSQGVPSLLLFRLASDTAVPGPWGWAEATGVWGDPGLEGWRVGPAWCGDLPGVRLWPQAWSPREEFQALGSPLPGPGVPGLRGWSGLLGPGPDGAGPALRVPPLAAAGQGPARGDDAACRGRAPALSAGQYAGPRGCPAP